MTKPDRVEQIVRAYSRKHVCQEWLRDDVLILLRREQRRPIRLIQRRIRAIKAEWTEVYPSFEVAALERLLAALRDNKAKP